ncbi:MAG: efflux RND transporter periplasmic adaptor subunit, partial [Bryobacteraceae bacterium]
MDVPRKNARRNKIIRRSVYAAAFLITVPLITLGLSRLKPAAPPVERATVWIDSVKRGPMLRQVRGLGTLVPEQVLWIPAQTAGRVERIFVQPGAEVKPDTLIMELSNPQLQLEMVDAEWQVKQAEANYTDLRVRLASQLMDAKAAAARLQSEYVQAKLKSDLEEKLDEADLTSELSLKTAKSTAEELLNRSSIEKEKLGIMSESIEAQLASQRVQIQKLQAAFELKKDQVDRLRVRAGTIGVLQQLGDTAPVEVGQQIAPGSILAKIVQPWNLKAELKIAETQAKDIAIGQPASIDTRNGIIPGSVSRIDPAAVNGTVTVDVKLKGELPQGARPDLSVDGTIELERLDDVLYVGRPVFGQPDSTVTLFKLDPDEREAQRVQVKLGRSSVNTIEIREGLLVGDKVILSDMSAQDAHN